MTGKKKLAAINCVRKTTSVSENDSVTSEAQQRIVIIIIIRKFITRT